MRSMASTELLEPLIFRIRGHRVMLDADLARLYGVPTKRFNEAFKRNRGRFPEDFAFRLTPGEIARLRSQFATSNIQPADLARSMWSQFATTSRGGRRGSPWVFTEHGALMAANVLRREEAIHMSFFVVRAFVRLRDLYQKLLPLLQPPADPPKRRIGFHTDSD